MANLPIKEGRNFLAFLACFGLFCSVQLEAEAD